jgi:hypothetical protein
MERQRSIYLSEVIKELASRRPYQPRLSFTNAVTHGDPTIHLLAGSVSA